MNKILVIAVREYLSVVRSKAFIVSLVLLPIMMFAPGFIERQASKVVDTKDRNFAIVDRTPGQRLTEALKAAVEKRNAEKVFDSESHKQVQPKFVIDNVPPASGEAAVWEQRLVLADRVRSGEIFGIVDIGAAALVPATQPAEAAADDSSVIRYQSNAPTYGTFRDLVTETVEATVRSQRLTESGVSPDTFRRIVAPISIVDRGLTRRDETGKITDNPPRDRWKTFMISFALVLLMFMIVLTGAIPLMQGVVEEKQNRIAEVLLGSVSPFQLMSGKVLGMVATSMTLVAVYLIGGLYMLKRMAGEQYVPSIPVLLWFGLFTLLSVLMFGSLYIAIGASCTDSKEVQSLIMPVNVLLIVPLWLTATVINNPTGPIARLATFFPPATPMIAVARLSVPPGIPIWETVLAVAVVLLTTVFLIWASGKIFRIGILLQGKGASMGQILQWVARG